MKIDLMRFVEDNKEIDELRKKAKNKTEVNKLITSIINGEDEFYSDEEDLLKEMGLKYKKRECSSYSMIYWNINKQMGKYKVNLTKENIKKVQKYIDNWEEV